MIRKRFTASGSGLILCLLVLVGCGTQFAEPPPTPTLRPVAIVRPLATVGPTMTVSDIDRIATLTAAPLTPSAEPPTLTPSVTPYVGIFLGQAPVDPFEPVTSLNDPSQFVAEPTFPESGVRVVCEIEQGEAMGTAWQSEQRVVNELGCPIQIMFRFDAVVQIFERGAMYLRTDTGEVWAFAPGGLEEEGRYWYIDRTPDVASLEGITAPSGFFVPDGLIGAAWVTFAPIRDALGFAVQPAQPDRANLQRFAGGSLFLDNASGQVFALLLNGDAYGPYEANLPEIEAIRPQGVPTLFNP